MDLALFDFDGTITSSGTYLGFVKMAVRPTRKAVAAVALAPILMAYQSGLYSDKAVRRAISWVGFWRESPARVRQVGEIYARDVLPEVIRPVANERIRWHLDRGDRVVVVSASLSAYLAPWCRALGVDLICTELEERNGRLTGRYVEGDCCGPEKEKRIKARYALDDYPIVYAYGDTDEDRQMLQMASKRFFRWQEVSELPPSTRVTRHGDGGT